MMKKYRFFFLLMLIVCMAFVSCGKSGTEQTPVSEESGTVTSEHTEPVSSDSLNTETAVTEAITSGSGSSETSGSGPDTTTSADTEPAVTEHVHDFSNTAKNETYHWNFCSCGEKEPLTAHAFVDWIVDKEANCTENGSRHRICSVCGYSSEEKPAALGHNFVDYVCTRCNADKYSKGLYYETYDGGKSYVVCGIGTCRDTDVIIPAKYNGAPVKEIGSGAFYHNEDIFTVDIPDSVTRIGEETFSRCHNLETVKLPGGLTSIEEAVFCACTNLKNIALPDSVKSIGVYAFAECGLNTITLPDGLTTIGDCAFFNSGLNSITIPGSVKVIGEYAFYWGDLIDLTILDGVEVIGSSAFANNWGLNTVSIPDTVTRIEERAFESCNIESLKLPDNLISIGDWAFAYNNLSNVIIPDKVTYLGIGAFDFEKTNIEIAEGNTAYCSKGNCVIEIASKKLVYANAKSVIPDDGSVLIIGEGAYHSDHVKAPFENNEIIIPEGITEICDRAFECCGDDLTSITIPVSVKKIGNDLNYYFTKASHCDVYYLGTCAQWNEISVGEYPGFSTVICSDGVVTINE